MTRSSRGESGWTQRARVHRARLAGGLLLAAFALAAAAPAAAQVPSGATPPPPSEQREAQVDAAVDFREDFGLRSDRAYVAALEAGGERFARGLEAFGFALTSGELAAIAGRERVADAVGPVVERYVERRAGDSFAGLYIDQADGGTIRVGFTDGASERLRRLRSRAPFPGMIETFRADDSEAELERLAREVSAALPELGALGAHRVSLDVSRGVVRVVASEATDELRAELAERFPGEPLRLEAEPSLQLAANYDRFPTPPMLGALEIYRNVGGGRSFCSAGFLARNRGGARRMITAGHCGDRGDLFRHDRSGRRAYRIGRVKRDVYRSGSTADALVTSLRRNHASDDIYTPGTKRPVRDIKRVQPKRNVIEGELVCRSGAGSDFYLGRGVYCGRVTDRNAAVRVQPGNVFLRQQVLARVRTCTGDSGGPVYTGGTAKGVVSAYGDPLVLEDNCGDLLLYSKIANAERRLRTSVLTR